MLADPRLVTAREMLGAALVKQAVARAQELARSGAIRPEGVADAAAAALPPTAATLTPVINATGVIVHTNLGRAPLSAAARAALAAAAGYTDVEFDLASGQRGGYLRSGRPSCGTGPPDDAGRALAPGQHPRADRPAAPPGPSGLPPQVADAVRAVLAGLAGDPFRAPDADRMRELGLDQRAAAAAERAGLLRRLPGNVLLAPDAPERAARILADLPQPFTAAEARRALGTSRRVAIPLLEWLDREGVTRRLADDRRTMREPPGSPGPNGGR